MYRCLIAIQESLHLQTIVKRVNIRNLEFYLQSNLMVKHKKITRAFLSRGAIAVAAAVPRVSFDRCCASIATRISSKKRRSINVAAHRITAGFPSQR